MRHHEWSLALFILALMPVPALAQVDPAMRQRFERGPQGGLGPAPRGPFLYGEALHMPAGGWRCIGSGNHEPIYASPSLRSRVIALSPGRLAGGGPRGDFTTVLVHEGVVGYVRTSSLEAYRRQPNWSANCIIAGARTNGTIAFALAPPGTVPVR